MKTLLAALIMTVCTGVLAASSGAAAATESKSDVTMANGSAKSVASARAKRIRAKAHRNAARAKAHARALRESDTSKQ
jgi:ABC-type transporter MlaC component